MQAGGKKYRRQRGICRQEERDRRQERICRKEERSRGDREEYAGGGKKAKRQEDS